jgi:hypothetical protein
MLPETTPGSFKNTTPRRFRRGVVEWHAQFVFKVEQIAPDGVKLIRGGFHRQGNLKFCDTFC